MDHIELAATLQEVGVAAAPVLNIPGVLGDVHLDARSAFQEVQQPRVGALRLPCLPIHFSSASKRPPMRPAALLGQNNKSLLVDLAGLSESELGELEDLGVVTTEPPL